MIKFNEIDLDFESREKIASKIPAEFLQIEMTEFESAFLCGMLKKFQPKKIVEVGVACGGTTAIMLQCLEDIGQSYTMDSVDAMKNYYRDPSKEVGFSATYAKENNVIPPPQHSKLCGVHKFHLGTILPSVIEQIGNEIDFVILDTMHSLPGEVLDFLTVLPYLKNDAVIVMHDVAINQRFNGMNAHATTTLFSAVTANKFLNYQPDFVDLTYTYPNIAAFQINEQTRENVENVFLTLILRWQYFPHREQIRAYYNAYQKNYSPELCKLFEEALKMNYLNLRITDSLHKFKNGEISI